jgi:hypothetical protein
MKRWVYLLRQTELHVLLFVLGFVSLNWPILNIFQGKRPEDVFIYLFVIWGVFIFVLLLVNWGCKVSIREDSQNRPL